MASPASWPGTWSSRIFPRCGRPACGACWRTRHSPSCWSCTAPTASPATATCPRTSGPARARLAGEPPVPPRLVTGHDLLALGLAPGPRIGQILRAVEDARLEGRVRTREEALALARDLAGHPAPPADASSRQHGGR